MDRVPHPAYNISTGRGETIVEFADAVKAVIPGANIEVGPGLDFFEYGAPGGYYLMDPTLAREDLGFEAQCSPRKACAGTWRPCGGSIFIQRRPTEPTRQFLTARHIHSTTRSTWVLTIACLT